GVEPSEALGDNQRFKVVWQVLNALRSHDERFDAMVNSIALNGTPDPKSGQGSALMNDHIGPTTDELDASDGTDSAVTKQMALFSLSQWQEAIYARIVDKVGTRTYWEQWASDVADIAARLVTRITVLLDRADADVTGGFDQFLTGLRDNLNDSISRGDAISMLAQHLITKPVFDALFSGHDFASHNPVSRTMQKMVDTLGDAGLEAETQKLEGFYASVRRRASEVTSAEGKQQVIAELYEKFFRIGFKKQSDALGIVYTPTELVDFILRAADTLSRKHFGRGLTDERVHVLDAFAGTGTFITRLLQSDLITADDLARKYTTELHANEIMLLAYYIAAVNIETTYHALAGMTAGTDDYEPFQGIVLADTFQINEAGDSMDSIMFPHNNARIEKQLATPMNVIVGNPPYSVGQADANDLNANVKYPTLDSRIEQTYAKRSTATSQRTLYDSYVRAFRWATDRIGDAGVIGFVSNGGWIDANTADGMRLSLADDYSAIYVYNLRGNQRTAGELSRREGGKVFGGGSRNTVAIFIGVKDPNHNRPCAVFYRDIGDYLSREEKLRIVDGSHLDTLDWESLTHNAQGDWVNQRDDMFSTWPAIGDKKATPSELTVFKNYSLGLATGRDAWCYNSSRAALAANVHTMIETYETVRRAAHATEVRSNAKPSEATANAFLEAHPQYMRLDRISWNRNAKQDLAKDRQYAFHDNAIVAASYRPFTKQNCYFHRDMNAMLYQLPAMFPTPHHENIGILITAPGGNAPFTCRMTDAIPDLVSVTGAGNAAQFFPRWTYGKHQSPDGELDFGSTDTGMDDEKGYHRVDNIADGILNLYRDVIGTQVTKGDIFYYVYGLLHDPA
ncbi:MAG: type ISP restriction/modification enzyme, partial [Mycobacterium sp.]